jgi:hypothetical protein
MSDSLSDDLMTALLRELYYLAVLGVYKADDITEDMRQTVRHGADTLDADELDIIAAAIATHLMRTPEVTNAIKAIILLKSAIRK